MCILIIQPAQELRSLPFEGQRVETSRGIKSLVFNKVPEELLDQDEVLSTPIGIARTLPDDILRLAGYCKAVSGVGYVEDHQNPVEFMQKQENGIGKFGPASDMITV
ncbi:hypothetical protein NOF04DRAFT_1282350 [Fusarium oxysporum II5]|nr:hypothetical protein NOF04DRAFT_1282350 [Fusarium oxysporum II5]